MSEFLGSITAAAANPYALTAYAIAAVLFLFAGAKVKMVMAALQQLPGIPQAERRAYVERLFEVVLPEKITPEIWLQHNRQRWTFTLLGAVLIVVFVIAVIAIVNPTAHNLSQIETGLRRNRLSSLTVDEVELWMRREEVNAIPSQIRPDERAMLSVHANPGSSLTYDAIFEDIERRSLLNDERDAERWFDAIYGSVCSIELSPSAVAFDVPENESLRDRRYLASIWIGKKLVSFQYKPKHLPAIHFNEHQFRLYRPRRFSVGVLTDPSRQGPCSNPSDLRIVVRALGFCGDTGFFKPSWNSHDEAISPSLNLHEDSRHMPPAETGPPTLSAGVERFCTE